MHFKRIIVNLLLFFILILPLLSAERLQKKEEKFFKGLIKDHGKIWTSPLKFKFKNWIMTAVIAGITTYLIINDESIYGRMKAYQNNNKWVSDISPGITLLGDGTLNLGISGLFFLSGSILKDNHSKNTGKLILMGLIHSGIVVQLLKHLSGRQRPEAGNGVDNWEGPAAFFERYKDHRDMYHPREALSE